MKNLNKYLLTIVLLSFLSLNLFGFESGFWNPKSLSSFPPAQNNQKAVPPHPSSSTQNSQKAVPSKPLSPVAGLTGISEVAPNWKFKSIKFIPNHNPDDAGFFFNINIGDDTYSLFRGSGVTNWLPNAVNKDFASIFSTALANEGANGVYLIPVFVDHATGKIISRKNVSTSSSADVYMALYNSKQRLLAFMSVTSSSGMDSYPSGSRKYSRISTDASHILISSGFFDTGQPLGDADGYALFSGSPANFPATSPAKEAVAPTSMNEVAPNLKFKSVKLPHNPELSNTGFFFNINIDDDVYTLFRGSRVTNWLPNPVNKDFASVFSTALANEGANGVYLIPVFVDHATGKIISRKSVSVSSSADLYMALYNSDKVLLAFMSVTSSSGMDSYPPGSRKYSKILTDASHIIIGSSLFSAGQSLGDADGYALFSGSPANFPATSSAKKRKKVIPSQPLSPVAGLTSINEVAPNFKFKSVKLLHNHELSDTGFFFNINIDDDVYTLFRGSRVTNWLPKPVNKNFASIFSTALANEGANGVYLIPVFVDHATGKIISRKNVSTSSSADVYMALYNSKQRLLAFMSVTSSSGMASYPPRSRKYSRISTDASHIIIGSSLFSAGHSLGDADGYILFSASSAKKSVAPDKKAVAPASMSKVAPNWKFQKVQYVNSVKPAAPGYYANIMIGNDSYTLFKGARANVWVSAASNAKFATDFESAIDSKISDGLYLIPVFVNPKTGSIVKKESVSSSFPVDVYMALYDSSQTLLSFEKVSTISGLKPDPRYAKDHPGMFSKQAVVSNPIYFGTSGFFTNNRSLGDADGYALFSGSPANFPATSEATGGNVIALAKGETLSDISSTVKLNLNGTVYDHSFTLGKLNPSIISNINKSLAEGKTVTTNIDLTKNGTYGYSITITDGDSTPIYHNIYPDQSFDATGKTSQAIPVSANVVSQIIYYKTSGMSQEKSLSGVTNIVLNGSANKGVNPKPSSSCTYKYNDSSCQLAIGENVSKCGVLVGFAPKLGSSIFSSVLLFPDLTKYLSGTSDDVIITPVVTPIKNKGYSLSVTVSSGTKKSFTSKTVAVTKATSGKMLPMPSTTPTVVPYFVLQTTNMKQGKTFAASTGFTLLHAEGAKLLTSVPSAHHKSIAPTGKSIAAVEAIIVKNKTLSGAKIAAAIKADKAGYVATDWTEIILPAVQAEVKAGIIKAAPRAKNIAIAFGKIYNVKPSSGGDLKALNSAISSATTKWNLVPMIKALPDFINKSYSKAQVVKAVENSGFRAYKNYVIASLYPGS